MKNRNDKLMSKRARRCALLPLAALALAARPEAVAAVGRFERGIVTRRPSFGIKPRVEFPLSREPRTEPKSPCQRVLDDDKPAHYGRVESGCKSRALWVLEHKRDELKV